MSGRFAAECVARERARRQRAGARYARAVEARFRRRLDHRVTADAYLERSPRRSRCCSTNSQGLREFAEVLQKEDHERHDDRVRLYLYTSGAAFRLGTFAAVSEEPRVGR